MRGPIKLFSGAIALTRDRAVLLFGIILPPMLLSYIAGLLAPARDTGVIATGEWLIYLALLLASSIASVWMAIALLLALDGRVQAIGEAYRRSFGYFVRYVGLSIVTSILLMIGFVLLLIPGIILMVWFAFANFVLVLENTGIRAALRQSREYVRGRWWGVFGRLIAMFVAACIAGGIFVVIGAFIPNAALGELVSMLLNLGIVPVLLGYVYLMYQDVKTPAAASAGASFAPASVIQSTSV